MISLFINIKFTFCRRVVSEQTVLKITPTLVPTINRNPITFGKSKSCGDFHGGVAIAAFHFNLQKGEKEKPQERKRSLLAS